MFDLATAIEWVKNYIEYFGGDPNNIVPMGQGSGASSAVFMGLSNVTQGKFDNRHSLEPYLKNGNFFIGSRAFTGSNSYEWLSNISFRIRRQTKRYN